MKPSTATVTAALVAAAASLVVAIVSVWLNYRSARALEAFKHDLAGIQAEHGAQLSYEYEARKNLYAEFYPLLFQLVEACESAYNRIEGLAIAVRKELLQGFQRSYDYRLSNVYRLICPLAVFRLCQTKLTSVDLTLDPWVRAQYLTAKQLYGIWISAAELAEAEPSIRYEPILPGPEPHDGCVDPRQHLSVAQVELLIEGLQVRDDKGPIRCKSFGEFIAWDASLDREDDMTLTLREAITVAMALFDDFHPGTRPVLWRALLAEAHLSKLLIQALEARATNDGARSKQPTGDLVVTDQERAELDWTRTDTPTEQRAQLADSFRAVSNYLADRLTPYGLYLSQRTDTTGSAPTPHSSSAN